MLLFFLKNSNSRCKEEVDPDWDHDAGAVVVLSTRILMKTMPEAISNGGRKLFLFFHRSGRQALVDAVQGQSIHETMKCLLQGTIWGDEEDAPF